MIYDNNNWINICDGVSKISKNIVPYIKQRKVLSGVISNIFETYSAEYFNKNNIKTKSSANDRDPDLFFIEENFSCDIKVTGVDSNDIHKKVTWMGGRYCKRSSDHLFIMWNYSPDRQTLFGIEKAHFSYFILKTFVCHDEWTELSNSKDYYALGFNSALFKDKKINTLVGDYKNGHFTLEKFYT